jgi:SAM-dependent methyltransferase
MNSAPCPCCLSPNFAQLIDFGLVPRSGTFLANPGDPFSTIPLAFDFCESCALLRQRPRPAEAHDYTDVSRSTGRQLPPYAAALGNSFQRHGLQSQDLVVEIGSNDGTFIDLLARSGFTRVFGVEPSRECAAASLEKGHQVEITHLDQVVAATLRDKHGAVGAVVCRHTLEHVPDPFALLVAMKSILADDGLLFVEIPNADAILHDLHGHELWDEHLNIMTPANLAALVRRAGFSILDLEVWPHGATTNILIWARNGDTHASIPIPDSAARDLAACRQFESRWSALVDRTAAEPDSSAGPVAAIGASHPQSNYLLFTKLGAAVTCLVDDDPYKAGKYVPIPKPTPILSTAQFLAGLPPAAILCTAFGYNDWMNRALAPFVGAGARLLQPYAEHLLADLQDAKPPVDITIAVTCYNEEAFIVDSIENVASALRSVGRSFEIIVIDDVSKDNSAAKVREYMRAHPELPITLKVNETNRGLANNCVEAAFLGRGKYYRLCCGDNPEPNEMLVASFRHIGEADIIVPYQNQQDVEGKSAARKFISQLFTFLVNTITGYDLNYYNGMPIYRRYDVMRWHPSSYGFGFQADILTSLLDEGATYMQVPSMGIDRKGAKSTSVSARNILSVTHTLLELSIRRLRRALYGRTMRQPTEVFAKS